MHSFVTLKKERQYGRFDLRQFGAVQSECE